MAGDWLKIEAVTPDKPEVWSIAESLGIDPDAAFGKVFRVWAYFDAHTEEGNAPSVTKALLDRKVGVSGFIDCMIGVGWMDETKDGLTIPNFDDHNGQSAKRRANTAKRVAKHKKSNAGANAEGNAPTVTKSVKPALPREEKRREEKNKKKGAKARRFQNPKIEELTAYVKEKGLNCDPLKFINYYESKGWKVGKSPMKDWKAAARGWSQRQGEFGGQKESTAHSASFVEFTDEPTERRDAENLEQIAKLTEQVFKRGTR